MREIGAIDSKETGKRFLLILMGYQISAELREEKNEWGVWVHNEEDIAQSKEIFKKFIKNPDSKNFIQKASDGEKLILKHHEDAERHRKSQANFRKKIYDRGNLNARAVFSLIIICILLFLLQEFERGGSILQFLYFSELSGRGFYEINNGQVWRLFTPSLLHAGMLHLAFNMLWLLDLGGMIEKDKGPAKFLGLFLLTAGLANTAQYLSSGPNFVGMSGVVYGCFGFAWMKAKFSNHPNYTLSPITVGFLLIWFFLCIFSSLGNIGILGRVANANHGVGLCVGMVSGFISSGYLRNPKEIKKLKLSQILIGFLPFLFAFFGIFADIVGY